MITQDVVTKEDRYPGEIVGTTRTTLILDRNEAAKLIADLAVQLYNSSSVPSIFSDDGQTVKIMVEDAPPWNPSEKRREQWYETHKDAFRRRRLKSRS
jgi:hypothetical protein